MSEVNIKVSDLKVLIDALDTGEVSMSDILSFIKEKSRERKVNIDEIVLKVDYARSVLEMIIAGNYDLKHKDITEESFPLENDLLHDERSVAVKFFYFNRNISSGDVIFEMNKAGYRPAVLSELLGLGELYPDLQKKFPIVALGSSWCDKLGFNYVPVLNFINNNRKLDLEWFKGVWFDYYRFLAVRK